MLWGVGVLFLGFILGLLTPMALRIARKTVKDMRETFPADLAIIAQMRKEQKVSFSTNVQFVANTLGGVAMVIAPVVMFVAALGLVAIVSDAQYCVR